MMSTKTRRVTRSRSKSRSRVNSISVVDSGAALLQSLGVRRVGSHYVMDSPSGRVILEQDTLKVVGRGRKALMMVSESEVKEAIEQYRKAREDLITYDDDDEEVKAALFADYVRAAQQIAKHGLSAALGYASISKATEVQLAKYSTEALKNLEGLLKVPLSHGEVPEEYKKAVRHFDAAAKKVYKWADRIAKEVSEAKTKRGILQRVKGALTKDYMSMLTYPIALAFLVYFGTSAAAMAESFNFLRRRMLAGAM